MVDVHFEGVFFLTQKRLPLMSDGGRMVNISSGLTRISVPGGSTYAAAKAAVEILIPPILPRNSAPQKITANAAALGPVQTDMVVESRHIEDWLSFFFQVGAMK